MSGPKVVRIVTREELIGICQGQLARVDAALEDWLSAGRRNACIDDDAIAAAQARRDELATLIAADRFADLQKQAPIEAAFLRDDIARRLEQVAQAQAAERSRQRREREAASAILAALRRSGRPLDADLETGLERADPAATSQALLLLADRPTEGADDALAARLREHGENRSFADWMRSQPSDPAIERIETRISRIQQIEDTPEANGWRTRLAEATDAHAARRDLILDTLEVETGRALTAARRRSDALSRLRLALAEAETCGLASTSWSEGLDGTNSEQIEDRIGAVETAIEESRAKLALAARRMAVIEGLSGLGYEVAEGMSTAWAADGRLVLRNAARPDYGVEVSGADRFQMRPVAFDAVGARQDPSRDRDAEQIWCTDVGKLETQLAERGSALIIEKSRPVGTVPLKRVAVESAPTPNGTEAPTRRERTLR